MEVIGSDGLIYDVDEEDLEGDVLGYGGPMGDFEGDTDVDVEGYDDDDDLEGDVIGARRRRRRRRRRAARRRRGGVIHVRQPGWRRSQLAPGVIAPDQGMLTLPLAGLQGQQFTAAIPNIVFAGQTQKPFRGERLLVAVVRTGATAVGRLLGLVFAGTDLQQLDVARLDVEQLGDPGAFGVRLAMKPVQPGVLMRIDVTLSAPLTEPDTIDVYMQLMGRAVH